MKAIRHDIEVGGGPLIGLAMALHRAADAYARYWNARAQTIEAVEPHNHGLICRPQQTLQCGLCGETYIICTVCHRDVYGHHAKCEARDD